MTLSRKYSLMVLVVLLWTSPWATAQLTSGNPIITHIRSADPSAQVWEDGKVWIYASHDQDHATDYSTMDGYHAFSSYDLVNWTDHGEILHSRDVSWGVAQGGWMFAPDAAYKNGTYYLYFPTMAEGWKWRVGVATSDKPEGPFTDIGYYIEGTDQIDPTCFVDDDGQAYLIWGGDSQAPKIARLKENMTELAEEPRILDYGAGNFGEGPFMHKRNGIYYFSYTCHTCYPYQGYYAMGDNPYGPFEYKGELNLSPPGAQDHHSIIEYHGQWYYFYHVGNYNGGSLYRRNVCVDSLFYHEDGSMQEVIQTTIGVGQDFVGKTPGILIPGRMEAEDYFRESGIDTLRTGDSTGIVTGIHDSDWLEFVLEILGSEEYMARLKVLNPVEGSKIYFLVDEILQDSLSPGADMDTLSLPLYLHQGKHTLKLLFSHPDPELHLMSMDWMDLHGETSWYRVDASATEGGSIYPEGTMYLTEGDSLEFRMDWELGYKPDGLSIDQEFQDFSNTYRFRNIAENHSIKAIYTACSGIKLEPYIQVNDKDRVHTSEIRVTEGDDVILGLEYEDPGILSWLSPNGKTNTGKELTVNNIQLSQGGTYSAFLTDREGCKIKEDFQLGVDPFVLDVYEAERWIAKSGVVNDICTDVGGGQHIGYIDNGDWASYGIEIDQAGIFEFTARVATASDGGEIEMSIEDQILGSIAVSSDFSSGWQDWYTSEAAEVLLESGEHELKLTFKGGEGYLFNLNWFDLSFKRTVPVSVDYFSEEKSTELISFPLTGTRGIGINYSLEEASSVNISIIDLAGVLSRTLAENQLQQGGSHFLRWDGRNESGQRMSDGIYILVFSAGDRREVRKITLFSSF